MHILLKHSAYKFVLHPMKEQKFLIAKTFGYSRHVFNYSYRRGLSYGSCSKKLSLLKQEFDWLKEVDSMSVQMNINHLADAYERHLEDNTFVIVLNHSNENVTLSLSIDIRSITLQNVSNNTDTLRPYEARIYKTKNVF